MSVRLLDIPHRKKRAVTSANGSMCSTGKSGAEPVATVSELLELLDAAKCKAVLNRAWDRKTA
jgi:hypothetical protein